MVDYHIHSEFSMDSEEKIELLCEKAIELGIEEIALTDHFEMVDNKEIIMPEIDQRALEIEKFRTVFSDKLKIYAGVEVGQLYLNQSLFDDLCDRYLFDFVIASVHSVTGFGSPSQIVFSEKNIDLFFEAYFEDLQKTVDCHGYNSVGHVTFPFRYIPIELRETYGIERYFDSYEKVFRAIVRKDTMIEINTSGYRTTLSESMPNEVLLRLYKDCGGKIVSVGSDGHSCRSAYQNLDKVYKLVDRVGLEIFRLF